MDDIWIRGKEDERLSWTDGAGLEDTEHFTLWMNSGVALGGEVKG